MRADIVRQVAYLYIEHRMTDLMQLDGAKKIHEKMQRASFQASLKAHVDSRITKHYPPAEFPMPEGAVLSEFKDMARASAAAVANSHRSESGFDNKRSTMPDATISDVTTVFKGVRPQLVVGTATVSDVLPQERQSSL